jgi:hypothetical protein
VNRVDAIKLIEESRKSKVICYLTGDRLQFATNIGEDVIPILYRHLELMGKQKNIDLFLYTRGGDMVVPIRIVKLIKTYCEKFSVIIPFRCHSAGTLISLGADEIIMTKLAELTPVDPTSQQHPFNPKAINPLNPSQQIPLPVSVEDVRSYLSFAKEELDAQDQQIVELYSKMTNHQYSDVSHLHPLALGNVYRVQKMIKKITKKLLQIHFKNSPESDHKIDKIVKEITENISVHNYPIYFDEAEDMGLKVMRPNEENKEEKLIWQLFELYSEAMKLNSAFNAIEEIGTNNVHIGSCKGAFLESVEAEDAFTFNYQISKIQQPGMPQPMLNFNVGKVFWEKIR